MAAYSNLPPRDSLELASLASSAPSRRSSRSSSPSGISSSRKLSLEDDDPLGNLPTDDDIRHGASGGTGSRPNRHRTFSVASTFDFANSLFPLSSSAQGYTSLGTPIGHMRSLSGGATDYGPLGEGIGRVGAAEAGEASLEKQKSLTYLNGLTLIIGIIIGSGIFSSPSQVNSNAGSPGAAIVVWIVAGCLAWTGASCFAELGAAIPLNGGAQIYLAKIFGDLFGFLFAWCAVLVLKPGAAAIISLIFGEYVVRAAVGAEETMESEWAYKGVAFVGIVSVTVINAISTKLGARTGDIFTLFKFFALVGITVVGVVVAATGFSATGVRLSSEWKEVGWFEGTSDDLSSWAVALYAGLWAFDGWDNTNYVVGELRNPRDLPRVIHTAMPLVILCFVLANLSYIFVVPTDIIANTNAVAVVFGSLVFGKFGAVLLSVVVSLSCFGALNAGTFTSSRLIYSAGKEGFLLSFLGKIGLPNAAPAHAGIDLRRLGTSGANLSTSSLPLVNARQPFHRRMLGLIADENGTLFYTPINALVFNCVLTAVYISVGSFATLVTFYGVAGYAFYFLTVLGLIVLRVREPDLERPYKCWLITPIIFCCVSLFLLSRAVVKEPIQTLIVIAFIVSGIPVYLIKTRGERNERRRRAVKLGAREEAKWWQFWRKL